MAEIKGYNMPDELYYHVEHSWARVDGTKVTVGMTDFFQKEAGDVVFVDLPEEEDEVEQGTEHGERPGHEDPQHSGGRFFAVDQAVQCDERERHKVQDPPADPTDRTGRFLTDEGYGHHDVICPRARVATGRRVRVFIADQSPRPAADGPKV